MKYVTLTTHSLFSLPLTSFAADPSLQVFIVSINSFLGTIVLPTLLAIAFLFLVFNVVRYFILESDNEDGRTAAKNLAIYGTLAFVFIVIFWGLINFFASSIGLDKCDQPMPDYDLQHFNGPFLPDCLD